MSDSTTTDSEVLDLSKMKKHVTWDETTIAEHNKERGTRQVINEPKTPYCRLGIPEDPDAQEVDMREELLKRLQEVNESRQKAKTARCVVNEKPKTDEDDERHRLFALKRKAHYNEYQMVLKMREQMKREDYYNDEEEMGTK